MKKTMTYEELSAENVSMKAELKAMKANEKFMLMRIDYLERMLYGEKSDKLIMSPLEKVLSKKTPFFLTQ